MSAAAVAADIETRILDGRLRPGDRLEPVRVAAIRLGLAPNTVAAAYRQLGDRALVRGRGRLGTFVMTSYRPAGQVIPELPEGIVDLASGRPDPGLLPDLGPFLATLGGSDSTYGDPSVWPGLEEAARMTLIAEGVDPPGVAVTGGAVDAIERALGAWLRPGHAVAVEDPGWYGTVDLIRAMGLVPVPVAVDREGMRPEELESVAPKVEAVLVTPRAQNPTGAATGLARARALNRVLSPYPDLLVIEDDHMGPVSGAPLAAVGPERRRWVFIRSFAKAFNPDLRVAVVAADPVTIDRVVTRQVIGPGWVSHMLQRMVTDLLTSPAVAAGQREAESTYRRRRDALLTELEAVGVEATGSSGLNVWVSVEDEESAVRSALDAGFGVGSGRRFRQRSGPGVRVTISSLPLEKAGEVAAALRPPRRGPPARGV